METSAILGEQQKVCRSRRGCYWCRVSKKKCSEKGPICARCEFRGKECIWPQTIDGRTFIINGEPCEVRRPEVKARSRDGCFQCRQKKKKCTGNRPRCRRCALRDEDCHWPAYPNQSLANYERQQKSKLNLCTQQKAVAFKESRMFPEIISTRILVKELFFNVFFNVAITSLIPPSSMSEISELTYRESIECSMVKKVIISYSAALLGEKFTRDLVEETKQEALDEMLREKDTHCVKKRLSQLQCSTLLMLRDFLVETNPSVMLRNINYVLKQIRSCKSSNINNTQLFVDSFTYHYSVCILSCTNDCIEYVPNPFVLGSELEQFFPEDNNILTNPLLGRAFKCFIIAAKASYILKSQTTELKDILDTMVQIDEQLQAELYSHTFCTSDADDFTLKMVGIATLCASKILITKSLQPDISASSKDIIDIFTIGFRSFEKIPELFDYIVCGGIWALFVLGICAQLPAHQSQVKAHIHCYYRRSHKPNLLNVLGLLEHVWENKLGLDILDDHHALSYITLI
ncbi:hypothetical protein KL925_003639 [Ogataea polymorpha]|nr:hypothetical protein KL925_003639 [Ogataea polymorpha]